MSLQKSGTKLTTIIHFLLIVPTCILCDRTWRYLNGLQNEFEPLCAKFLNQEDKLTFKETTVQVTKEENRLLSEGGSQNIEAHARTTKINLLEDRFQQSNTTFTQISQCQNTYGKKICQGERVMLKNQF